MSIRDYMKAVRDAVSDQHYKDSIQRQSNVDKAAVNRRLDKLLGPNPGFQEPKPIKIEKVPGGLTHAQRDAARQSHTASPQTNQQRQARTEALRSRHVER